jgi:hypothetical protein
MFKIDNYQRGNKQRFHEQSKQLICLYVRSGAISDVLVPFSSTSCELLTMTLLSVNVATHNLGIQ